MASQIHILCGFGGELAVAFEYVVGMASVEFVRASRNIEREAVLTQQQNLPD
jgi:hypothetical protein